MEESRECQNCKQSFVIEAQDFDFYKKINVPPPTWCPQCRLQRRLSWWNVTKLYRRKCDLCKKESISTFHPNAPYTVYCPVCWWSDEWDPEDYAMDYDFSRPFFGQFDELMHKAPLLSLSLDQDTSKRAPYNNHAGHLKNCYMLFDANGDEDCYYGFFVMKSNSTVDSSVISYNELCYDMMHSWRNNHCVNSRNQLFESINCAFMRDSGNCQDCFGCANLYKKQYYIFNEPYSKEDYFEKMKEFDLGSYKNYQLLKKKSEDHWRTLPPKSEYNLKNENSTGFNVFNSKNCQNSIEVINSENSKYLLMIRDGSKDCYDISSFGDNLSLSYEGCVVGEQVSEVMFSQESGISLIDAQYCKLSIGGSHHFGCVSAKKKDYMILNKRYTKEEFESLRTRIIQHMKDMPYEDKQGITYRYGEFFPAELSPFAYNESFADYFFPLTEEEAQKKGYGWRMKEKNEYSITKKASELPDHIKDAGEDLVGEVIECEECRKGFRILKAELDLLRDINVPLPRRCPMCRIETKIKLWVKNVTLIERACSECGIIFKTSYTEEEAPRVLCKKCYQEAYI